LASASVADAAENMNVSFVARVVKAANRRSFKRRMTITEAVLEDGTGRITGIWFNQPYLTKNLAADKVFRFTGKVQKTKFGLRLVNARHESAAGFAMAGAPPEEGGEEPFFDRSHTDKSVPKEAGTDQGLMPVYPVTAGISQNVMRALMKEAMPAVALLEDPLPEGIRAARKLPAFKDAVRAAHEPADESAYAAAKKRLAFDEALRLQLSLGRLRRLRETQPAPAVPFARAATKVFVDSLPFAITEDQRQAAWSVLQDMEKPHQMHRLLDGDVGSGKTVVAAIAMNDAAHGGFQSALMAPTEILAFQHFTSLSKMFAREPYAIALWTGSYKRVARGGKVILCSSKKEIEGLGDEIADGKVAAVIGTHALIEESLRFGRLALAVVDEQHRFGVKMRSLLSGKSGLPGMDPHLLTMTATPIPRTLQLAMYGDLDLSLLRQKPAGRIDTQTRLFPKTERAKAYDKVCEEIAAGRQAFIVCPLIDPSDLLGAASVTEEFEKLRKKELKGIKMGMLHGKMPSAEKEKVMADFLKKKIMALVSTSVVEVGVDVPNATVMCIEGAERFGLSQLHQFRGRVGRGEHASFCFLLPGTFSPQTRSRLHALVEHMDGFALAEKDLQLRGAGDLLGTAQSGFPELAFASLADTGLMADAKAAAEEILAADPELERSPALKESLKAAAKTAHLE
jgi:ATP-dependent DNA helicase RecG